MKHAPRKVLDMGLVFVVVVLLVVSIAISVGVGWYYESPWAGVAVATICFAIIGICTSISWTTTYRNDHWATCHVTGKDRGGSDGSYRIYTDDCGTLANEDSIFRGKFNSADVWQRIPGKGAVQLRIAGVRSGFFSQMPNVFGVRPAA